MIHISMRESNDDDGIQQSVCRPPRCWSRWMARLLPIAPNHHVIPQPPKFSFVWLDAYVHTPETLALARHPAPFLQKTLPQRYVEYNNVCH